MKNLWLIGVLCVALAGCGSRGRPSATIVNTRIAPFTNPQGKQLQTICVDWRNTGKTTIRGVKAKLVAYDAAGTVVYSVDDYYIYATGDTEPGIAPGETYNEPADQGHVILPGSEGAAPAVKAEATIIEALEKSKTVVM
jgi:hypothetical protein